MIPSFPIKTVTEILSKAHKNKAFNYGKAILDNYLHRQAYHDVKRKQAFD